MKIPSEITKLTGITEEMVRDADMPMAVQKKLLDWCGDSTIFYAHNAKVEAIFIKALNAAQGKKPDISFICTYEVAKKRLQNVTSYKLTDLVPGNNDDRNRALPDALACISLYRDLAATYKNNKIPEQTYIKHMSQIKMYDEPSRKQLLYIEALGGGPEKVKTKGDASLYIDELKSQALTTKKIGADNSGIGAGTKVIIVLFAVVIVYAVLQAQLARAHRMKLIRIALWSVTLYFVLKAMIIVGGLFYIDAETQKELDAEEDYIYDPSAPEEEDKDEENSTTP